MVHTDFKKKLMDTAIYLMLFVLAVTMVLVGIMHLMHVSIGSGVCYIVIGIVDLVMMALYHKGEFESEE